MNIYRIRPSQKMLCDAFLEPQLRCEALATITIMIGDKSPIHLCDKHRIDLYIELKITI